MAASDTDTGRASSGRGATRLPGGGMRRGLLRAVAAGTVLLLVAALAVLGLRSLTGWPFGDEKIDRSGPAVLTAMRDLSEYHAAAGQYQVVVDIEQDAKYLPDILKGKRVIFLAIGSVDAYVDFRQLGEDAVTISADRTSVSITLPRAQLSKPNIDPEQSRVLNQDMGVIDKLGGLFSDQPNPQNQEMYVLAQQRLAAAATEVGLQGKAEENTKVTLEKLMRSLGFTTVDVKYVDADSTG
ncbi:MAG: hypothetical protein AVDCRST_MAG41-1201 [uncultured Corynebacteriales bacterium]|uniref:Secreted protein n=1 Tax=uncultured Mycobacteriales bacterium TaxID=581187 RepID=A0A6J4HY01_9ACTN|nr:MAG: hypothetical protein AVDCRST_MAG41-1201 [uncultured Corynebacteriales bacterium]